MTEISAGGLVVDQTSGAVSGALIGRRSRSGELLWSLPKGHVEDGETSEQAAIREIAEETGIVGRILDSLGTIDFWFVSDGHRVHKTVHHFLLARQTGELSDSDIEVAEVAWVRLDEAARRLAYRDEQDLLRRAAALLADCG